MNCGDCICCTCEMRCQKFRCNDCDADGINVHEACIMPHLWEGDDEP